MERADVLTYLRDLADALGRIPLQNYGEGMDDLLGFSTDERLTILTVLTRKPTVGCGKGAVWIVVGGAH